MICEYCGNPAEGNYSVHRDGFGEGPEVWLCDFCGGPDLASPSLQDIWAKIAKPEPLIDELQRLYERAQVKPRGHS